LKELPARKTLHRRVSLKLRHHEIRQRLSSARNSFIPIAAFFGIVIAAISVFIGVGGGFLYAPYLTSIGLPVCRGRHFGAPYLSAWSRAL
jgi:uncharacterized membrane protein YfcA